MNKFIACSLLAVLVTASGCCASPYRIWQNGWGFNDAYPDPYAEGPPPPRTTPAGPTMSVKLPKIP